jgi:hypothetical protein
VAELDANPADLQRAAQNYAELHASATTLGPHAVDEVQRIIATHGPIGYPLAIGVVAGLARRQAALNAKANDFATYNQRLTEHAAAYQDQDHDNTRRYHTPTTEPLDDAITQEPPLNLNPPEGRVFWCTPSMAGGFVCEVIDGDGTFGWQYSPTDITGGTP